MGNKAIKRIESQEKKRRFIADEDSESEPNDESNQSIGNCLQKANDFELLHGCAVDQKLLHGRHELEESRLVARDNQKQAAISDLKRKKNEREHISSTQTINNTNVNYNININNSGHTFNNVGTVPQVMPPFMNTQYPMCSPMFQANQNLQAVPNFAATSTFSCNTASIDSLIHRFQLTCIGEQNRVWLSHYRCALDMFQSGMDLRRGYQSNNIACTDWIGRQKRNKLCLDPIKQQLLEKIGL
jgi:hypothetical protein